MKMNSDDKFNVVISFEISALVYWSDLKNLIGVDLSNLGGSVGAGRQDFRAVDRAGPRYAEPLVCEPALAKGVPRVQPPERAPW